eukprot:g12979.t1
MSEARASREKKAMERFAPPAAKEDGDKHAIYEGSGTRLGDIPIVPVMLTKADADHDLLKAFHSFLYGGVGKKTVRKKNIRSFSGFPEDDDKGARKNKLAQSKKWTMPSLRDLCQLLGLDKSGDKTEVVDRLVDFLTSPDPSASKGPVVKKPKPAPKKRKSVGKGKKAKKVKREIKPRPLSGYMIFVRETRPKVYKGNTDLEPKEIMAKMGEMWQACSDAQKEKYKKQGIKEFEKKQGSKPKASKKKKEEEEEDEEEDDEEDDDEGGDEGEEDDEE